MNKVILSLAISIAATSPVLAADLPISLSKQCVSSGDPCSTWDVTVVSKTDAIKVLTIVANRGNCKHDEDIDIYTLAQGNLPWLLKFGQSKTMRFACANLVEFNLTTDQGDLIFKFNE